MTDLYFRLLTSTWRTIYHSTRTKTFTPTYVHMSSFLICFHTNKNIKAQNEILFLNASVWSIHSVYMYPYTRAVLAQKRPFLFSMWISMWRVGSCCIRLPWPQCNTNELWFFSESVFQNLGRKRPCNVSSMLFLVNGYK